MAQWYRNRIIRQLDRSHVQGSKGVGVAGQSRQLVAGLYYLDNILMYHDKWCSWTHYCLSQNFFGHRPRVSPAEGAVSERDPPRKFIKLKS